VFCCTSSPCGFSHCRISGDYIFARARFCFSRTTPLAPASGIGPGSLLAASTETVLVAFIPSCMTNDDWISIRRLSISTGDAAPQHRTDRALDAGGLPLGIKPDTIYETETPTLETGDWLVVFTDAVVEAVNEPGGLRRRTDQRKKQRQRSNINPVRRSKVPPRVASTPPAQVFRIFKSPPSSAGFFLHLRPTSAEGTAVYNALCLGVQKENPG